MLRLVLTQYSVATIPATLDQVKVSEMTRADRRRVRALFLLGCNDHVLPQVNQSGGILDRKDRSFLQEHDLPLADASFDELDNELQNIYSALTQPTERLCVSYPTVSLEGSALRPAFVVERIRRLLPQVPVQKEDGAYRLGVPATALEIAGRYPGTALADYSGGTERTVGCWRPSPGRGRWSGDGCHRRRCVPCTEPRCRCPRPGWIA